MPRQTSTITQDQYSALMAKLEGIERTLTDIQLQNAERKHIDTDVQDLKKMLAENGKWGFIKLRDWAMAADDEAKYRNRVYWGLTVTNIFSLAVAAFFWFVKILPVIEKLK